MKKFDLFHRLPPVLDKPVEPANEVPAGLPADFWDIDESMLLQSPDGARFEMAIDIFFNSRHFTTMDGRVGPEHLHSYRLQVRCQSRGISTQEHVIVGYAILRERMKQVVEAYNNKLLNDLPSFRHLQPTTEVLAAVLSQQLTRIVSDLPVDLISVTVWESPTASITFYST